MDELEFIIDTMTWSFSRLNSFYNCPYEFFLHYVQCNKSENGFFGEYGTLIHTILEKYAKGELSIFELNQYYEEHFNEYIPHDAPPNKYIGIRQSYFDKGIEYLNNIDISLDDYEILGVEKEVKFKIADKDFVGYIDLLVRDKNTKEVIIIDHKSSSIKILKNGAISKSDQRHFLDFKRQLYLYSISIIEEYGGVSKLKWNMFKEQKWIEIPWKQEEYDEAIKWAKDTIKLIEKESLWLPNNKSYYYCNYLCGQRNNACEYKPQPVSKKTNDDEYYNPNE
ncbi:MAG: PD-(D/E)XK nuclease family protein [Ruminococcus flavefaciens]|nr:PD-(D/E)XK nuclease family protein [Ruminococcus flavefaciens]